MFTPEDREHVREQVFELARRDRRVSGGAVTGSFAVGAEDRWSDVDTSFGIVDGVEPEAVLADWTARLEEELGILHHWDLRHGPTIYRVLLVPGGLELNIAVTSAAEFGKRGPKFRLLFGEGPERPPPPPPDVEETIGFGWLYVLNSRTTIERGRRWQAENYVSAIRDHALALACVRFDEPPGYLRGVDNLPHDVLAPYDDALVRSSDDAELRRAFVVATELFLGEVAAAKPELADRLGPPLREAAGLDGD
ncbi:MAG: nucleotidyltransferase domain-containing protein [Actinomycetota bacterium]|nr:nucleotidyltransferase domain-containing protein [Actinomycetota bacterium]